MNEFKTLAQRLRYAMEVLPLRKVKGVELARAVGVRPPSVSDWLSGKSKTMDGENLLKAANYLNVDPSWLVTGKGSPRLEGQKQDGVPMSAVQTIPVESWDSSTPLDDDEIEIPFYKDFTLACGSGSIAEALTSEHRRLRLSKLTLNNDGIIEPVAMTAQGHSMSPVINDKATVYVDLGQKKVIDGRIYAVCHGGLFRFKYLYKLPNEGLRLVSENSVEYPEDRLTKEQMEEQQFEIIGWAFNVQNGLPR